MKVGALVGEPEMVVVVPELWWVGRSKVGSEAWC